MFLLAPVTRCQCDCVSYYQSRSYFIGESLDKNSISSSPS
jgi:hypothetical protein